ncbi:hypothetical protein BCD13_004895, partial [Escherichia coli]|nr:hypothetical protein [Escherichia coli]
FLVILFTSFSGSLVSRIPGAVQYIESGKLVSLLDDFLPQFPGFYLYFPQRRNIAPKLRALIDYVKEWRQQLA